MSDKTPNFNLFKYDTVADSESAFSITRALNNNWDLLDANCVKRNSTDAATGSPTRPVYVDEKGQIQACSKDLLDDGYLTATVLLDENGYIKFSNDFMMQFSRIFYNHELSHRNVIFPQSFKHWNTLIGVGVWIDQVAANSLDEITLTGFSTSSILRSTNTYSWLALGI